MKVTLGYPATKKSRLIMKLLPNGYSDSKVRFLFTLELKFLRVSPHGSLDT
jgi:hypothetical protein